MGVPMVCKQGVTMRVTMGVIRLWIVDKACVIRLCG
jgi:hypothetical protein